MADVRTPREALAIAKEFIKNQPFQRIEEQVAQDASDRIWTAAPWYWTVGTLSAITLATGAQDFNLTIPANFQRLEMAGVINDSSWSPVMPVSAIPTVTLKSSVPRFVAYIDNTSPTSDVLRLDRSFVGANQTLVAWYKKIAPQLLGALDTVGALLMPDAHYNVYVEFVLYYAYRYSDDQRAGSAQIEIGPSGRRVIYTGQLGVAVAALEEMRRTELLLWRFPEALPQPMKDA